MLVSPMRLIMRLKRSQGKGLVRISATLSVVGTYAGLIYFVLEVLTESVIFNVDVLRAFMKFGVAYQTNGCLVVGAEQSWCLLRIAKVGEELSYPECLVRSEICCDVLGFGGRTSDVALLAAPLGYRATVEHQSRSKICGHQGSSKPRG